MALKRSVTLKKKKEKPNEKYSKALVGQIFLLKIMSRRILTDMHFHYMTLYHYSYSQIKTKISGKVRIYIFFCFYLKFLIIKISIAEITPIALAS